MTNNKKYNIQLPENKKYMWSMVDLLATMEHLGLMSYRGLSTYVEHRIAGDNRVLQVYF